MLTFIDLEERVPVAHPLRAIERLADEALADLSATFDLKPKDGDPPTTTDDDPGNPSVDFRGEKRSNKTHWSTTDPDARLMRKGEGKEARLVFMGHALME